MLKHPPDMNILAAWRTDFQGTAHLDLINNIIRDDRTKDYSNTGIILQSSGYGKSRTVDEAAKLVTTIPMNIRAKEDGTQFGEWAYLTSFYSLLIQV